MNKHYTKEHIDYLRTIAKGRTIKEITEMFNTKFRANRTERAIGSQLSVHKIKTGMQGAATRFKKGATAWNKGKRMGPTKRNILRGLEHPYSSPVGSERIHPTKNRVFIKAADGSWRTKQSVIYEQHHGKIPDDHCVVFADGDKENFDIDNLIAVKKTVHLMALRHKLKFDDPALTRSGLLVAEVLQKLRDKEETK